MQELNAARIDRYSNSEFLTFISNTLEILDTHALAILDTTKASLQSAYDVMDNAFKKDSASLKTKDLKTLDKRRDDALKGIKGLARYYRYHFDESLRDASDAIVRSMDKYNKNIPALRYNRQTAVINSLLDDWATDPTLTAAITLLNLDTWKAELAAANAEFEDAYLGRNQEQALKDAVASATTVRDEVEATYYGLVRRIHSHADINPSPELTALMFELNAIINKNNTEAMRASNSQQGAVEAEEVQEAELPTEE